MGVAVAATVLLPVAGSHAEVGVLRDKQGNKQRQQHRARSKQERGARNDRVLKTTVRAQSINEPGETTAANYTNFRSRKNFLSLG